MCPFLEKSQSLCAAHLTLSNITSAFTHCAGRYEECPAYAELMALLHPERQRDPELVLAAAS